MDLALSRIDLIREPVKITHTWGGGVGVFRVIFSTDSLVVICIIGEFR